MLLGVLFAPKQNKGRDVKIMNSKNFMVDHRTFEELM